MMGERGAKVAHIRGGRLRGTTAADLHYSIAANEAEAWQAYRILEGLR
jgi:hypothetical protein